MTHCVLDSSVALAWLLPGETTEATDQLLEHVSQAGAVAPALWPLEVANVMLNAERAGRVQAKDRLEALALLATLPIRIDGETAAHAWQDTLLLAETHRLTLYDATYLELARRRALPLATLDMALHAAAVKSGVAILGKAGD